MADLTISGTVTKGTTPSPTFNKDNVAGEALGQGQPVYYKTSTKTLFKAQCDGTEEESTVLGITLHAAAIGQPVSLQTAGEINIGATVAIGETYVSAAAAGGIAPVGDLVTGNRLTYIGYGSAAGKLVLNIKATKIVKA